MTEAEVIFSRLKKPYLQNTDMLETIKHANKHLISSFCQENSEAVQKRIGKGLTTPTRLQDQSSERASL